MAENDEPLSSETSLSVKVDEAGLDIKSRSRLVTALDRLTGNLIDLPATWLEGHAQQLRSKNRTKQALEAVDLEAALARLKQHPDAGLRTLDIFLNEQLRKQQNRDAVALEAVEHLKALPAPNPSHERPDKPIDEDWMNIFSAHAENASSAHLRSLWGRILAGEVRQPGTFSLSTLRLVAELDKDIATIFQHRMADRLQDWTLPIRALEGEELRDLSFLEDVGLLNGVGNLGRTLKPEADGYRYIHNGEYVLRVKDIKGRPLGLRLDVAVVTRIGRELGSILPSETNARALRHIATCLPDDVESIELYKLANQEAREGELVEVLKASKSDAVA